MSFFRRWLVCIVVLLGVAPALPAQGGLEWMTSRAWRIQDGLPDQVIQAIVQTPDHYLWIGTKLGLVRFDGYHFLDYGADLAPVLHDFGVDCILVARDGTLWLGTQGGGVVHLAGGTARTYGTAAGVENGLVRALYQDETGRIWAGADRGLYRLDSALPNDHFIRMDDPIATPDVGVHTLVGDGHRGVWAGGTRLLHFHAAAGSGKMPWEMLQLPPQPASIRIWSLALAEDGGLWIGTLGGLYRVPAGASVGGAVKESRIPGSILSLYRDRHHRLWVGTLGEGLYLLGPDGSVAHASAPAQLGSNAVLTMVEDLGRDLWVGTQSGLNRFSVTGMQLTRIPGTIDSEFGSVSVDTDGSVWVCSRQLMHIENGVAKLVALPMLDGITVRSVMRERSGAFWVGTLGNGAYRIAKGLTGHTDHYAAAIGTNYIRGFLETPEDGVWIASDGGLANWKNGVVTSYQESPNAPHAAVNAMASGAPGELWVGTFHGVSLWRRGQFVDSPASAALGSHMVWALHVDDGGALWIGTEGGLYRWQHNKMQHLPVDADMGSPAILSILEDSRHRIWLGGPTTVLRTKRGALVSLGQGKAFEPEIFPVSRETGAELSGGAASTATLDGADGAWFASNEGPLHIESEKVRQDGAPPPVMLGQVSVDGQRVAVDGKLVLQPSVKTLQIDATPIALGSRPGLQLRRKLIGFDTEWSSVDPLQPATYTNLPPGSYIYRVEASWKGFPGITRLELPIVQRTHLYRQPVFLIVCVAVVLLLIWLVHWLRVQQVTLRFRLIAEERNRVAREMHDTVVQSCIGVSSLLEAIAIRQTFSTTATPVSTAAKQEHDLLNTAREQIAITIIEAREAIWNLRHPQNDGGLAHALRSMLDRMTAIQNTVVEFTSEGEPTPLDDEPVHELLMTAREALHNAIVHAAPSRIDILLQYEPGRLTIRICDDGVGFDPATAGRGRGGHYGLLGMHERMERIGGSCTIESVPGSGAEVILEMPLGRAVRTLQETR
ncbi:sensor histidine kinase [Granulicella rosea]|uniref:sensor histidine kinase n=1 Tax=Granulicella rosea TaxID=474952 RepID=UPI000B79A044|nr:sensor histidine kinase [Granulicella rosea]